MRELRRCRALHRDPVTRGACRGLEPVGVRAALLIGLGLLGSCGNAPPPAEDGRYVGRNVGFTVTNGEVSSVALCDTYCGSGVTIGYADGSAAWAVSQQSATFEGTAAIGLSSYEVALDAAWTDVGVVEGTASLVGGCGTASERPFVAYRAPGSPSDQPRCGPSIFSGCEPPDWEFEDGLRFTSEDELSVGIDTSLPIRWVTDDACLPMTFGPTADGPMVAINDALRAWEAIECSALCFGEPEFLEAEPDLDADQRGIHIRFIDNDRAAELGMDERDPSLPLVKHDTLTGELVAAMLYVRSSPSGSDNFTRNRLMHHIGFALGLGFRDGSGHIMSASVPPPDIDAPEITQEDAEHLCALYGHDVRCDLFRVTAHYELDSP